VGVYDSAGENVPGIPAFQQRSAPKGYAKTGAKKAVKKAVKKKVVAKKKTGSNRKGK